MKNIFTLIFLAFVFLSTGCSIKHPIAKDYGQYLTNNKGRNDLPQTAIEADYLLSKSTINHRYEFRAVTVGYAHLWIVEFGNILDETLKSEDVQAAFGRLTKLASEKSGNGYFISFNLENYEFKNHRAYISLNIALSKNGKEILNKTYTSTGKVQGAKMFLGGPFAMKNATQQSTKLALDQILREFIQDINMSSTIAN